MLTDIAGIDKVFLCNCTNIPLQLLKRGLFACAPNEPTLAVDLTVLDLVQELFVNTAPNTTAWCETLENFLDSRGFKLTTRVCVVLLWIPFGKVLTYWSRTAYVIVLPTPFAGTPTSKISKIF